MRRAWFYQQVEAYRKDLIVASLTRHGGNRTYAAQELGLQRTFLHKLIREYKIDDVPARLDTLATQQDAQRRQPSFSFRALGVAMQCEASFGVWCVTFSLPDTDHTRIIWAGIQFEHRVTQAIRLMQRQYDVRDQHRLSTAINDIAGAPAHRIECACGWKGVWYAHLRALDRSRWRHLSTVELPIGGFIS